MILNKEIFTKEPSFLDIPDKYKKVEDLYLSFIAKYKYNMSLVKIDAKCSIDEDGKDQYQGLIDYKQTALDGLNKEFKCL
jgi:hypothetical protein